MRFDTSETTTILIALRMFQKRYQDCNSSTIAQDWPDYFTAHQPVIKEDEDPEYLFDPQPLGTEDIDALCERINCEPERLPGEIIEFLSTVAGGNSEYDSISAQAAELREKYEAK